MTPVWNQTRALALRVGAGLLGGLMGILAGCGPQKELNAGATVAAKAPADDFISYLKPTPIGSAVTAPPWIAHILPVDLDKDGRLDLVVCEARENKLLWLRQTASGTFEETILADNLKAPVHVDAADMDGDGDLDLIVSSMGVVFPDNDRIGTVYVLENDGHQHFTPHVVLENTSRVTDARAADINGDGKMDLVLAQFGYDQGEVSWLERTGPWQFSRHVMLDLSGAINVCVADLNGDGKPDVVALMSQQWEEIHYFENDGRGNFTRKRIWGSTNEDFGSSGISVCDLNRDGRPDILYTNGDGFGPASTRVRVRGTACNGWKTPATEISAITASATCPALTARSASTSMATVRWMCWRSRPTRTGTTRIEMSFR